jgi:hypothetical protein
MQGWLALVAAAWGQDRAAVGVGVGGGISPMEPAFGDVPGPGAAVTLGVEVWGITERERPSRRYGVVCAGGFNQGGRDLRTVAQQGGCGAAFGAQWGRGLYLTAWSAVGVGTYSLLDVRPDGRDLRYTSVGPWVRPKIALGIAPASGLAVEAGPYASIVVPLATEFHNAVPSGRYLGQVGLEVTVLVGSPSPVGPR